MAAGNQQKRIIRVPVQAYQVVSEVTSKLNSLKLANTNVFITVSDAIHSNYPQQYIQFEAILSSANDTTFASFLSGWATLMGVAQCDTETAVFSAGN